MHKEVKSHPANGVISISRVSSTGTRLFGSDFAHQNFVSIKISTAKELERFGVQSSIMSDETFTEVAMSEAQFGRLVSSLNLGFGTPCTIEHVRIPESLKEFEGKPIPRVEEEDVRKTHKDEIKETVNERLQKLRELERTFVDWRNAKRRPTMSELDEIIHRLQSLHLASNFSYFQQILEEKMEMTIDEGRTEIEAHASRILQKLGLDAIHRKELPEAPHGSIQRLEKSDNQTGEGLVEQKD